MRIILRGVAGAVLLGHCFAAAAAVGATAPAAVENYVRPYVETNNFSGVILAARDGAPVFTRAYGFADFARRKPTSIDTRFHIASMSMQYTSAAIMRLVMRHKLALDTSVSWFVPDFPNGQKLTIRHLLTQTSGIRDINGLPDYEAVLKAHQTPRTLVEKVKGLQPQREPGSYEHEEHSAFNLLALIVEQSTGLPFARAVEELVFRPLKMHDSGIDDDGPIPAAARGHAPVGVHDVGPADPIHWSAKAGNASAYTTAGDQLRFVEGLFDPDFLDPTLRDSMFDLSARVGYGWFKSNSSRFKQPVYSMNGRAPGFASALTYFPRERLLVIAFSNVYASFAPDIAADVAAIMLGLPYQPLQLKPAADPASLKGLPAQFRFDANFYQPNAVVRVASASGGLSVVWPSGDVSPLIPTSVDHWIDRSYGVPVEVIRDAAGQPISLKYDRFTGARVGQETTGGESADLARKRR